MTKNHLANETSPYLLQHADNPVDWYPWGEEALAKARREQKPILLSIGYSACHWCHVMAHESFGDAETAKIMNEFFVNIKVDREERPDLDKIYQTTHQLLTQRAGGWPLTVFLTPDKQIPFFSGTYFPVEPRYQMPAFKEVLLYLAKFYQENKNAIEEQNQALLATLDNLAPKTATDSIRLNLAPIEMAIKTISSSYDHINGGFGDAPKFPHPIYLELLLQEWIASGKKDAAILAMLEKTLTKMAEGGLYDQLGGGFYRYSVDAEWHIPHFEKMLYDNAQLLSLYAQAYAVTNNPLFAQIARETGEWVIREMQSPEGGYYSTLDADSEGEEGKFYLWDTAEIKNLLTPEEYQAVEDFYGLANSPNFEHKWHLQISQSAAKVAKIHLESAKQKLMQTRDCRTYQHRDEKILSAWNGLMIKAMMEAGKFLKNPIFINSAQAAIDFIRTKLWINNRLFATYKDDRARYPGYLDDYVFLLAGTLTALEIQWRDEDFYFAIQLAEVILQHFKDDSGGFFFTADDQESLIHRPKSFMDEAVPSSNGIAALLFNRLWYLTGDLRYRTAAETTLKSVWQGIEHYPEAHGSLLLALAEVLTPPEIIIIRGKGKHIQEWQQVANDIYAPHRLVFAIPENAKHLPVNLAEKKLLANVVAYICRGEQCLPPITNINEFTDAIKNAQ